MSQQTHYFFAVKIPDETKTVMKKHMEKLKTQLPFNRWVHEQDLHITLAFLGNAPQEMLEKALTNVKNMVKSSSSFPLNINKLGIFGSQEAPRIFWADTTESKFLKDLQRKVYQACEQAGFILEKRPFRPHITLARKWMGQAPFEGGMLDYWNQLQPEPLVFQVSEIILYQTHLDQTPKYEAKVVYQLE